ncbi:RNA-directed DNA polymerase, eukaryota, reverse transcriptase zinc-binding domain protein [Tanacetum coccineum]
MCTELKQKEAINLIRDEKLQLCAFIETHLKHNNINKVGSRAYGQWDWSSNIQYSPNSCRIMVGWNANMVRNMIINMNDQTILCCVETIPAKTKFFCSIVYASNNPGERRKLWRELEIHKRVAGQHPWVLLGDFNVTLDVSEHSAGMANRSQDMQEFFDAVNSLEIDDICSSGFHYTWTKSLKNPKCSVLKKLDRIMINEEFSIQFKKAHGIFLPYMISDHSPAMLIIHDGYYVKKRSFKFSNFISKKKEFTDIVRKEWKNEVQGCYMYRLVKKLKQLKKPLNKLSWNQGNVFENVRKLKEVLKMDQEVVDRNPFDDKARCKAAQTLTDLIDASKDEISLLHQKAKINWLKDGDKNTAFFHSMIKARRNKNRVESIKDEDGNFYEGNNVAEQFVKHFKKFLGEATQVIPIADNLFKKKISNYEAQCMIKDVSDNEIKEAILDIDSNKAAGPDGYSSEFFKAAWDIVGKDVCLAVKEFFRKGKLLGEVNATLIALIPKIPTPNKVSEFRPIACCNVIYKCISKILTNRIKGSLSEIVNINQSAFIPGRHIQDNILLAQELLRGYNRKNGPRRCAMQVDIQKAYDTVSWNFLEDVLIKFGFPNKMVRWIMVCVSSSAFSICLNGEVHGYFKGGRGLSQGDPISPYLFTLVMEVFNIILCKNIEDSEKFNYHFGCKELKLTHMCFADDLLVLCKGNKSSVEVIKRSMEEFSSVSGLNPNIRKSTIFFGNVKGTEKQEILDLLPFKCGRLPVRYLGVPLLDKRLGVKDCKVLIDKVESKIKCWRNKTLSYAGRIQLVASNSGDSAQGKSKIAWKLVCRPKDQGGLGIKPLKKWNEVLLIRQFWKIIENNESLWAKWVNLVKLKKKSIWNVQIDKSDSWGWKTMLKIRDEIKNHVWYKIGNGKSISVFYDRWCSIGPLSEMISRRNIYNERLRDDIVIADIVNNGRWAWPEDWMSTYPSLSNIQNPNLIARDDKVLWITKKGDKVQFSTKQAWEDLRDEWPKLFRTNF